MSASLNRRLVRSSFAVVLSLGATGLLLGACSDDAGVEPPPEETREAGVDASVRLPPSSNRDAGLETPRVDAGRDAGPRDAGNDADAAADDAGDSGIVDSGTPDADAAPVDSGVVDSGVIDSGTVDSGTVDSGSVAGPLGAGPLSVVVAGSTIGGESRKLQSATFVGNELAAFTAAAPSTDAFNKGTTSVEQEGISAGIAGWGRWTDGTASVNGTAATWANNGGAVYAIGQRPGIVPGSGTAALTAVSSVSAIQSDGLVNPGTFTGTAAIAYTGNGGASVGLSLTLHISNQHYQFGSAGGSANPSASDLAMDADGLFAANYPIGPGTSLCPSGCTARVRGFVGGPTADHVGVAVHMFDSTPGAAKTLNGVLVFKKP